MGAVRDRDELKGLVPEAFEEKATPPELRIRAHGSDAHRQGRDAPRVVVYLPQCAGSFASCMNESSIRMIVEA